MEVSVSAKWWKIVDFTPNWWKMLEIHRCLEAKKIIFRLSDASLRWDPSVPLGRINVLGGSVALGHPLGCSGARIICTLITTLKEKNGRYGISGICNGGGGASSLIIQNIWF